MCATPASQGVQGREGAWRRLEEAALLPFSGACSSFDCTHLPCPTSWGHVSRCPSCPFILFSFELRNEIRTGQGLWQSPPQTGINTQLVAEFGHLLEAEVSFHLEMPLQVPRNKKKKKQLLLPPSAFSPNSAAWEAPSAHLADESRKTGLSGQQVGEVREKVSGGMPDLSACGGGGHFLPSAVLPGLWNLRFKRRCELALSP